MNDELEAAGAWIAAAGLELDAAATTLPRCRAIDRLRREETRVGHQSALEHPERLMRPVDGDPGGNPGVTAPPTRPTRARWPTTGCV